jgi:hypothetical protein
MNYLYTEIINMYLQMMNNSKSHDDEDNDSNDNNNDIPDHNCVYLCLIQYDQYFICKKYDTFKKADNAYKNIYLNDNLFSMSTMIPVCRYIPTYFHRFVLHYKLSNIFVKVRIQNNKK